MNPLTDADFTMRNDPFGLFAEWLAEAERTEPRDPNAIALATVDEAGMPNVRMVLLKGADERGFVFYTNEESAKGRELAGNGRAGFVLYWKTLNRQIRVRGLVGPATEAESNAYFASRHPRSRLGAIASRQSRPLDSRETLEAAVADLERRYGAGDIPRPAHWHGFRIRPLQIEFWQDRSNRLHDRILFARLGEADDWTKQRLYP